MTFPEPVISLAIEPASKKDQEKLGIGLNKLSSEDPSFKYFSDEETGQTIISGMGELHLEIIVDRLKREHKVEVNTGCYSNLYFKLFFFFFCLYRRFTDKLQRLVTFVWRVYLAGYRQKEGFQPLFGADFRKNRLF